MPGWPYTTIMRRYQPPQQEQRRIFTVAAELHFLREPSTGDTMEINWSHDVEKVLADARNKRRRVLLDFSAAPM